MYRVAFLMVVPVISCTAQYRVCEPDNQQDCECKSGLEGTKTCLSDGSAWGECNCEGDCTPDCTGIECGQDPICGKSCGNCDTGETCNAQGICESCDPDCDGRDCGPNGCGGNCQPGCGPNQKCTEDGHCTDRECEDKDGDGYGVGPDCHPEDCNDYKDEIHPGAIDDCGDGKDQDCDAINKPCTPGDLDADSVSDMYDNCIRDPNPFQVDSDGDGYGDACDGDIDDDGVLNEEDNCVFVPNPDQLPEDRDTYGDDCDNDHDFDGILDHADNCIEAHNPSQQDNDGDGIGNACDYIE